MVIDPGCYFDHEKETLVEYLEVNGLKPKWLINTHCHLDHVFGNKFVADKYSLKLHLHEKEVQVLQFAPTSALMYNMPFDNYTGEFVFLNEGEVIKLGEDELKVIFTPGHSPASLSFYCAKDKFVVSGDVLFQQSIGRTDLPGGNYDLLINSIKTQLFTLPDDTIVYSGHGPATSIGEEKKHNPYCKVS